MKQGFFEWCGKDCGKDTLSITCAKPLANSDTYLSSERILKGFLMSHLEKKTEGVGRHFCLFLYVISSYGFLSWELSVCAVFWPVLYIYPLRRVHPLFFG